MPSILNNDWYNRLREMAGETNTASIRGTGSEVDDPYWNMRKKEDLNNLALDRRSAIASLVTQGSAMRASAAARRAAYQQRATAGLKAQAAAQPPVTQLGMGAAAAPELAPLPQAAQMPNLEPGVPPQAAPGSPEAYAAPYSRQAQLSAPAYNPSMWANPALSKRKSRLGAYYENLAKRPIY